MHSEKLDFASFDPQPPQILLRQIFRVLKMAAKNLVDLGASTVKYLVLQVPLDAQTIHFSATMEEMTRSRVIVRRKPFNESTRKELMNIGT